MRDRLKRYQGAEGAEGRTPKAREQRLRRRREVCRINYSKLVTFSLNVNVRSILVKVGNITFLNDFFGVLNTNIHVTKPKFEFVTY